MSGAIWAVIGSIVVYAIVPLIPWPLRPSNVRWPAVEEAPPVRGTRDFLVRRQRAGYANARESNHPPCRGGSRIVSCQRMWGREQVARFTSGALQSAARDRA